MARGIVPETLNEVKDLVTAVIAKDTADGAGSVIRPYLTEKGIVLADDLTAVNDAKTLHQDGWHLRRISMDFREMRDKRFKPIFEAMEKIFQFLKTFHGKDYAKVGLWGAPITTKGAINYPAAFSARTDIFTLLLDKYSTYAPGTSPIEGFLTENDIDLTALNTKMGDAISNNSDFLLNEEAAENKFEQRDAKLNPVIKNLKGIVQILLKIYITNPRKAGLWGFIIDESPRAPKLRTSKIKPLNQITTMSIVLGGTLTNIGSVDIHLYKGKTTTGTPVILHTGDKVAMTKGYSTITVVNPSNLTKAVFTVLVH